MTLLTTINLLIQAALVIHVLKTGRNRYWIMALVFLPFIGVIAYFVVELLPEFSNSLTGRRAVRSVKKALNPDAELKHARAAWEQSANADNSRRYAEALINAGKLTAAEDIVNQALKGLFSTEPTLLLVKAHIEYEQKRPQLAVEALELLQEHNPDFRSAEGHLLYARSLEATGELTKAVREYASVSRYFPGIEARYRLALCLRKNGNEQAALTELESILKDAKTAPGHFLKSQKHWLDAVKQDLAYGSGTPGIGN